MRRQEVLLNLTLVVIIGSLVYLTYEARQKPETIEDIRSDLSISPKPGPKKESAPDAETSYDVASADAADGKFGKTRLFNALLTPTPTPSPTPPPPPPTPDIGKALGAWKLLSVYEGKAMLEDVQKSAKGEEGAIWEMSQGQTKQVDVGQGVMKTATLSGIDAATDPYNPKVTFTLEDTKAEKQIDLDTEPAAAAPGPAPQQPK